MANAKMIQTSNKVYSKLEEGDQDCKVGGSWAHLTHEHRKNTSTCGVTPTENNLVTGRRLFYSHGYKERPIQSQVGREKQLVWAPSPWQGTQKRRGYYELKNPPWGVEVWATLDAPVLGSENNRKSLLSWFEKQWDLTEPSRKSKLWF